MNINPNHPCFGGPENGKRYAQRAQQRRRQALIAKIETYLGLMTLLSAIVVAAWLAEHDAPGYVSLPVYGSMIGFALALLMENWKNDDLS